MINFSKNMLFMGVIVILITINFLQNNKLTKSLLDYKMAIDFILQNAVFEKNEIIEVDGIKAIYNDGVYWMINNLDTEHYCNGDIIPNIKEADEWESLQVGAWCYYDNDEYYGKNMERFIMVLLLMMKGVYVLVVGE